MLNPSGLNFIPRGFAPWDEIVPWDLQFQCIPQNDRAIIYVTYKKEMKFDDFVQLPAFEAQKNVVLQAANILS